MISTMTKSDFKNWFRSSSYKNYFYYIGLDALFDYLVELEESTGVKIEFDPTAIACDFVEYDSLEEIIEDYDSIETLEDLEMHTTVIPIYEFDGKTRTGGYIIHQF